MGIAILHFSNKPETNKHPPAAVQPRSQDRAFLGREAGSFSPHSHPQHGAAKDPGGHAGGGGTEPSPWPRTPAAFRCAGFQDREGHQTDVRRGEPPVGVGGGCTTGCSETSPSGTSPETSPGLMSPAGAAPSPTPTPQESRAPAVLRPSCWEPPCPTSLSEGGVWPGLKDSLPLPPTPRTSESLAARHQFRVGKDGEHVSCPVSGPKRGRPTLLAE